MTEGVTQFHLRHQPATLPAARFGGLQAELVAWRDVMVRLGGVGQDAARYDGAGYGNLSARVGPFPGARGARAFLITATQTGGLRCFDAAGLCLVRRCDARRNAVDSEGPAPPSSESLTHGAIYDLAPAIRYVFHVHCPAIWRHRVALRLPTSRADVPYGTPAMAHEMDRLARETTLLERRLLAMAGHEDGVIAFGRTAAEVGATLVAALAAGHQQGLTRDERLCVWSEASGHGLPLQGNPE